MRERGVVGVGGGGVFFFFFNDTATTEIYTLSLHDALPIWVSHTRAVTQIKCLPYSAANQLNITHCPLQLDNMGRDCVELLNNGLSNLHHHTPI